MAQIPPIPKNTLPLRVRNPEYTEPSEPTPPTEEELNAMRQAYRQLVGQIITDWSDDKPAISYYQIYLESRKRGANIKWIRSEIARLISQVDKYLNPDDFVIEEEGQ